MRPILSKRITIRISEDEHLAYLSAATDLGMGISEYLRLRLVSQSDEHVADQIAQLRLTLIDVNDPMEQGAAQSAMLLETLLLLRRVTTPADVKMVHAELQRLGYEPWSAQPERTHQPTP